MWSTTLHQGLFAYYHIIPKEEMTMWFEETKSGKIQFREYYTDPLTGKKKTVSITYNKHTRKNEQEALLMLQKKIDEKINQAFSAKDMTLSELIDRWLAEYSTIHKRNSIILRTNTSNVIKRSFGDILLKNLRVPMVNAFLLQQKQNGLKESTVSNYHTTFNLIFKFGKAYGFITDHHLMDGLKMPNFKQNETGEDISYLERDELSEVVKQLQEANYHELARLCLIQAYTGLRIGELIGIDYERQIDFDNDSILIDRTYNYRTRTFELPKTNKDRIIHFNEEAKKLLIEQIQHTKIKTMQKGFTKETLLFKNNAGNPMNVNSINVNLQRLVNIKKDITTHIFRHSFIAYMIEQGTPMELIAKHVGHTTTSTIQKFYYHFTEKMDEDLRDEILKMEL